MGEPGPARGAASPIVGGAPETGFDEVVVVARVDSRERVVGFCSGTVIGTRVVLTAKHCVFAEQSDGTFTAIPAARLRVIGGDDINRAEGIDFTREVARVFTTTGPFSRDDLAEGRDVALVRTTAGIEVAPREVGVARPRRGNPMTIVGFGRNNPRTDDSGEKHRGTATVGDVFVGVFEVGGTANACQGDSGGPVIDAAGRVLGVASFVSDENCRDGRAFYTEVVSNLALVATALGAPPSCTSAPERCDGADNDCDGEIDPGCIAFGLPCAGPDDCESAVCERVGEELLCGQACDPTGSVTGCPEGTGCEVQGCGVGRCRVGATGTLDDGSPCTGHPECRSGFCFARDSARDSARDEGSICARQCRAGESSCGPDLVCDTGGLPCGGCRVPGPDEALGFGSSCTADAGCISGRCRDGACTSACAAHVECPTGYRCTGGECTRGAPLREWEPCGDDAECSDEAPHCVRAGEASVCAVGCDLADCAVGSCIDGYCLADGLAPLGAACASADECASGLCAEVCTRLCDATRVCPAGFACEPAGEVSGCFRIETDDGGCSVGGSAGRADRARSDGGESLDEPAAFVVLLLFALVRRRHRRLRGAQLAARIPRQMET
jgi:hypothetical protein